MKEDAPLRARPPPTMLNDYVWGEEIVGERWWDEKGQWWMESRVVERMQSYMKFNFTGMMKT